MNGQRILVVSKDSSLCQVLTETLEAAGGYQVVSVTNFDDALNEVLTHSDYSLVVTEINLTVLSGIDLMAVIGMRRPNLPVIVIDEQLLDRSASAVFRLGAVDYLYKPLNLDFVLISVNRALERAAARLAARQSPKPAAPDKVYDREKWINPAARPAALVLRRSHFNTIEQKLRLLQDQTGASFASLIDSDHNMISAVGELANADLITLRKAFSRGYTTGQLANILNEKNFQQTQLEGDHCSVFITEFGCPRAVSLIVVCPVDTKPGMVWLWCKRVAADIENVIKTVEVVA